MANNTTFGGPTFNSDLGFDIGFSDDKKAFTATFSGLGSVSSASDRGLRQSSHAYFLLLSRCRAPTRVWRFPFSFQALFLARRVRTAICCSASTIRAWSSIFQKTRTTISSNNSTTKSALPPSFGLAFFS